LDVNTVDLSTEIADKLRTLEGPSHEVISQVFNILSKKKISKPITFSSKYDSKSVSCSYNKKKGHLYPLEHSLFFLHKPVYIKFKDMESVDFVVDKKNFNLNVKLSNNSTESFTGISKSEYNKLYSYIQLREIKITGKKQDIVEESIEDSEDKEEEKVEENISRSSRLGKREARKKKC